MKKSKEFFEFSKKELNGLLVFCFLLILIVFAPIIFSWFNPPQVYNYSKFKKEIAIFNASAIKKQSYRYSSYKAAEPEKSTVLSKLFVFNPNNLPAATWRRLGLTEKQVAVIKNYESKGGKFYKKEDLKKIYSIRPAEYSRLEPYINIPDRGSAYKRPEENVRSKSAFKPRTIIDINLADSIQLESINGVGPAFASRIIKYRNRLGGFFKKEQLKEVYGLDSAFYNKLVGQIEVNPSTIKIISVNTATFDDLKKHPYLTYKQMNAIIKYRKQHGDYKNVDDLKAVAILNENTIARIAPYLSFNSK